MRRFVRVKRPEHAHPLVHRLFDEMNRQRIGMGDMAERSGVAIGTIETWRTKRCPTLVNIEACFGVLGMEMLVRPRRDA